MIWFNSGPVRQRIQIFRQISAPQEKKNQRHNPALQPTATCAYSAGGYD